MKILGVDPGLINTGFGIISFSGNNIELIDFGIVSPDKNASLSLRLNTIYKDAIFYIILRKKILIFYI